MINVSKSDASKLSGRRLIQGLILVGIGFGLVGCSSVSKALGGGKNSPDEFAVVTKAPLSVPPDFALRPPRPGAPRPQEASPERQASNALFNGPANTITNEMTQGEQLLLASAGASSEDAAILEALYADEVRERKTDSSFANRILFWQK